MILDMEGGDISGLLDEVKSGLKPGEKLLWSGRPDAKRLFHSYDLFMIPFGVFFTVFACFWLLAAGRTSVLFTAIGSVFVMAGLYLAAGRLFLSRFVRQRTLYAVTDKRAIIAVNVFKKSIRSVQIDAKTGIFRHLGKDGLGYIKFGRDRIIRNPDMGWNYNTVTGFSQPNLYGHDSIAKAPGFYDLAEVDEAYSVIMHIIDKNQGK